MAARRLRFRLHVSVMTALLVIILVTTSTILVVLLNVSAEGARDTASTLFTASTDLAQARIEEMFTSAADVAATAAAVPSVALPVLDNAQLHPAVPYLRRTLERSPILYSIYVGHADGSFLQMIQTKGNPRILEQHAAPADAAFLLRSIVGRAGGTVQYWSFIGADGRVLGSTISDSGGYDPRVRPWYESARAVPDGAPIITEPYLFNSLQATGITAAARLSGNGAGAVVGVDLTLDRLQEFVVGQDISSGGGIAVLDGSDTAVAAVGTIRPVLEQLADVSDRVRGPQELSLGDGSDWFVSNVPWQSPDGGTWHILAAAPVNDFLGPFQALRRQIMLVSILLLLFMVPLLLLMTRALSRVLTRLGEDALQIRRMDFEETRPISSRIVEFDQLASGFHEMKRALAARTRDLNANMDQLAKIIELNIAITAEKDIDRLSELILQGARELTNADAGSLYLKNRDGTHLEFQIVLNETLGFAQGGTSGTPVSLPPVALYGDDGTPNDHNVVTHAFHTGETFNIADAYNTAQFDFSGTRHFDEANNYRSTSMLTVPLKPRGSGIIGAMQLINHVDPASGEIAPFPPNIQRFVEALTAGAATALYNRDLIEAQKQLFEAMIRLIAGAIDAKSPYTGGHCERVPVLAMMLGREAEQVNNGPLAEFSFASEQDWRAFRIGAWLHDAGKVTTPDFVVDKATKLETIYNRIHEVRTRFEVLLRDARIARHEEVMNGGDPSEADRRLAESERRLQEDFAFVAECNVGGEFMSDEQIDRLREIAKRTWKRHFDDSLGLSWEEYGRLPADRPAGLPVTEHLLDDKPEHILERTSDFYDDYDGYGFSIPVPRALYNRGELYNLMIRRGTLTDEERFKINEHVMQTIVMLEDLPFPDELRRVPEYAGTHHEALNGSGYPRRLAADQLSVPARIMAIADIFEALTASDRPYKRAKPLSVAVDILSRFRDDGHIDPELFQLFLTSGAYRRYAEQYLRPDQVDEVDISRYI